MHHAITYISNFAYDHRESHVFSREISVRNFW